MTMQRLCHERRLQVGLCTAVVLMAAGSAHSDPPTHDYPTHARVEYVYDCIGRHGGKLSNLYQCSCVIDQLANRFTYDDFVEASTYSRYASLPGEGGGIFRDSEQAKRLAKVFRDAEAEATKQCGLPAASG